MSYLLDTNVFSELRKGPRGAPMVLAWNRFTRSEVKFISVLTLGELRRGAENIRRRDPHSAVHLERWVYTVIREYTDRILPVGLEVADLWGRLCLNQPLPPVDGLLAATALHHDLTLVTRNVADVARSGARVFNPFEASA